MGASYPGNLWSPALKTNKVDLVDAAHINQLQYENVAIQTELGTNIAGTATDLKTRLAVSIGDAGGIKGGTSYPASPVANQLFIRTDENNNKGFLYRRLADDSAWSQIIGITSMTKVVAASDSISSGKADYICDGTNDNVEIQQAIDAVASKGGVVLLLEGTYDIGASIVIDSGDEDLILQGCGWGTILQAKLNLNDEVINCTADRVVVKDLKVDVTTNAQSSLAAAVLFNGADECLLENTFVTAPKNDDLNGPLIINDCDKIRVRKNKIVLSSGGNGTTGGIVTIYGGSLYGIIKDNIIDGAACSTNNSNGISGYGTTSAFQYCAIANNIIIGEGTNLDYGVYFADNAAYSNNIVNDNIIYNCATDGIAIAGSNAAENIVDGNMSKDGVADSGTNTVVGDNNVA